MASNSSLSSLTDLLVACMSLRSLRNAGISIESIASLTGEFTTEFKVLCCSLSASLTPLAIASSSFSLEMVESLNFFFIGDCSISLFRSPLSAKALMMGPMRSGLKFTDRITQYVATWAERKTKPASPSKGHVIPGVPPPEVQHNLLCLLHIEGQIVSATPFSQLCHFLSVVRFIVVADETYHCCVISELDDVVGAELGSAVVGQQCEEQRAEHTALWGTCAQCGSARGVVADTDWLRSSG